MKTPIAVFLYNRPNYTQSVLKSLEKCRRLEECQVILFSDGPKGEKDAAAVDATRTIAEKWATVNNAELVKRPANLGLARSIIGGVGELCSQYGRAIVLEDDFMVNPYFLDYMLQSLDHYQDEEKVAQVSGYLHPLKNLPNKDIYLLPLYTTRGWGTWDRVWAKVDWESKEAPALIQDAGASYLFDLEDSYPFKEMLINRLNKINEAWEADFWLYVFLHKMLVVFPHQSLVWVGGFDGTGVHSGNKRVRQKPYNQVMGFRYGKKILFPDQLETDKLVFSKVKEFLRCRNKSPSLTRRVKNKWLQIIGDDRPETI